jgi:hypothetical protein
MNYHNTFKKKDQEIFLRCSTLLICIRDSHADQSAQTKMKIWGAVW